jgi:hypothetical protein
METLAAGCFHFDLALDRIQVAATERFAVTPFEIASQGHDDFLKVKDR